MDDNTIQYQERTTTCADWEVLEKMLELVDETAIGYADFKVAKDYVNLHEQLQKCYSVKRKYENDHYLWLHAFGAELKSKEIEKEISSFSDTNSHSLNKLVAIGRKFVDFQDRLDSKIKLCDWRKHKYGYSKEIVLENIDALKKEIDEILNAQENHANYYFNKLIHTATMFCIINYAKRNCDFLLHSHLALVDTMAFTTFVNSRECLRNICREDLISKCERIFYESTINVLTALLPFSKDSIDEIFQNRISLYKRLYESSSETGIHKFNSTISNLKFILIQDKILGQYRPFYEDSTVDVISIFEMQNCVDEINEYLSKFFELYNNGICEAWDYLNAAEAVWDDYDDDLDVYDEDENERNLPINSRLFHTLTSKLKQGLDAYCKSNSKDVLFAFNTAVFESLASFSNGESGEDFDFSIKNHDEYGIQYIDFHFEENFIEVVSGGMEINSEVGSDSYTDWRYSIWNSGEEDAENITADSFDDILYMLDSYGIQFSISTPDEFEFDSELEGESLIDQLTQQVNLFEFEERKIYYYQNDGSLDGEEILNENNLGKINGMMVKCHMKNGSVQIGFADPYRVHNRSEYTGEVKDIIYLWTWDNIDETTHQLVGNGADKFSQTYIPVKIEYITQIDAIVFSNPRWGGLLTNKFYIDEI